MAYSEKQKNKIIELRKKGLSINQIANKCNIAKSTISIWIRKIILDDFALEKLQNRRSIGRKHAKKLILVKKAKEQKILTREVKKYLDGIKIKNKHYLLLCSFLYWAEGSKRLANVTFINSDPLMIKIFLKLFREAFDLDESKFRALVHLHDFHDEDKMKTYWAEVSGIPLEQFTKSYIKSHAGLIKRDGYKGCFRIRYYDVKIAHKLFLTYKMFSEKYI